MIGCRVGPIPCEGERGPHQCVDRLRVHRPFTCLPSEDGYPSRVPGWGWLLIAGGVIALAVLSHRLGWIDLSDKSRRGGSGPGVMGIGDEVFHPTRHEAQVELDRQTVLPAPAPLPGDGDKGISEASAEATGYSGRLRIEVSAER